MIHTMRVLYPQFCTTVGGYNGAVNKTFPWENIITPDSIVLISACEYRQEGVKDGVPVIERFLGEAVITITNIEPENGQVNFYMLSSWGTPVNVALDFVVIDPPAQLLDTSSGATYSLTSAPTPAPPGPIVGTKPKEQKLG